jgi:HD-GYP domain-containing protein (c-di-GMP phosphodiesterase class II)
MQFIEISQYDHETMQLARPVYDRMRRVLLAAGRTIHPKLIKRIQALGITTLMVEDADSIGITMDEMVDMPTWMDMIEVVQKAYELVEKKKPLNVIELQQAVAKMILEVMKRKTIFLIPSSSVTSELKHYAHSVNVTLLSIQVAKKLHYTNSQLRDLALGSLLHDIGKAVSKEDKEHPQKGFEVIKANREISLLSAHVAYQHHELLNGKGYPRGLSDEEILEFPQICAVANQYEKLISSGEFLPHEALEFIMTKHEVEYKGKIIEAFVNSIPSYIPGTKVLLSNDKKAIVVGIKTNLHRPITRLLDTNNEIDLAEAPSILIKELLV